MMDIYQLFMKDTRMCIDVALKLNLGEPSHCEKHLHQHLLEPGRTDSTSSGHSVRYANQEEAGCPRISAEVG